MASGADIQVELGNWAKVHNLILEKLAKAKLDGREAKCLFYLLRMTYGNQKKDHEISLSLWAEGTNIDKRHVKPVIDKLIERNIICRVEGRQGRGNTAIYGFNKYFEQWDSTEKVPSTVPFIEENVPPEVPIKKVLCRVPIVEEKVPCRVPEKVPSTVPIKERSSLLAATDSDEAMILVREAYQAVAKIGPPMREAQGRANLVIAIGLIEHFTFEACLRELATLKERNDAMVKRNQRGITSPLPYLRTLMEDELGTMVKPAAPSRVDFAIEDFTQ